MPVGLLWSRAGSKCNRILGIPARHKRSAAQVSRPHGWCARFQGHAWLQHTLHNRTSRTELGDDYRAASNQRAVTTQLLVLLPRLRDAGYDRVLIAATFRQALADVRREEHAGQSSVRNATAPLSRGLFRAIMLVHEQSHPACAAIPTVWILCGIFLLLPRGAALKLFKGVTVLRG